jgi:hypothetical protein
VLQCREPLVVGNPEIKVHGGGTPGGLSPVAGSARSAEGDRV